MSDKLVLQLCQFFRRNLFNIKQEYIFYKNVQVEIEYIDIDVKFTMVIFGISHYIVF